MGIIKKIRNWVSWKSPASAKDQKLRILLESAVLVVSTFGDVVERLDRSPRAFTKYSEAELPFSKEQIKLAIAILQQALRNASSRTILVELLSPEQAQHVLSSQFEQSLEAGDVILDGFVPDAEAKAAYQEWNKTLKFVGELDPTTLERIQRTLERESRDPELH